MRTLFHYDLTPEHSFVQVRLPGTSNSYTYITNFEHTVGQQVCVDARGKLVIGIISSLNCPIPTTEKYPFKCILGLDHPSIDPYQFSATQPTHLRAWEEIEPEEIARLPDHDYDILHDLES